MDCRGRSLPSLPEVRWREKARCDVRLGRSSTEEVRLVAVLTDKKPYGNSGAGPPTGGGEGAYEKS